MYNTIVTVVSHDVNKIFRIIRVIYACKIFIPWIQMSKKRDRKGDLEIQNIITSNDSF